jgi:hypothetical protein
MSNIIRSVDGTTIEITQIGKNVKFENIDTHCKIIFNTSSPFEYNIYDFTCGTRGGGNGAKLLYDALKYIKQNTEPRKLPFRLSLKAVPESEDATKNDIRNLIRYYASLGFQMDNSLASYGEVDNMFGMFDTVLMETERKLITASGVKRHKRKRTLSRRKIKRNNKTHRRR